MSKLEVDAIEPQSGTTLTIGASGDTVALGSGASLTSPGLTLSDNILFNTASKGIYLGVTTATASNLLDDYEEGTFSAGFNGSSSTSTGVYTKIGNKVFISVYGSSINVTSAIAGQITGLPFTVKNDSNYYSVGNIAYNTYAPNDGGNGFFVINDTYFAFKQVNSIENQNTVVGTGKRVMLSGFYTTDA